MKRLEPASNLDAKARILIVDDEAVIAQTLQEFLDSEGFQTALAGSTARALDQLAAFDPDLVITDIQLPDGDGLSLLKQLLDRKPELRVLVITAYATVENAVAAFRLGAHDYLMKPVIFDELLAKIDRALEARRLARENAALRRQLGSDGVDLDHLIGSSRPMHDVRNLLRKIGPTRSTVLITGESGTGKELAARALHRLGQNPDAPFLAINCAAIPSELLENQLFGHQRGSYTGADRDQAGLFVAAGRGTLFLDEVGELAPGTQAKLLRAIENKEVLPVGAIKPLRVEARVLAATNRDLAAAVEAGQFRADLYYRLNVMNVKMPPLRDRPEDIPELIPALLDRLTRKLGKRVRGVEPAAVERLIEASWKGNVRELENTLERAMILAESSILTLADLGFEPHDSLAHANGSDAPPEDLKTAVARAERAHILRVLEAAHGDKREAARRLGMGLSSLYRKLDEHRVRLPGHNPGSH